MTRKNGSILVYASLTTLLAFHLISNLVWLFLDKTPPAWDQAFHIKSVLLTNQWLRGIYWGNFQDLLNTFYGYPPLIYFITSLWSLITGPDLLLITLFNTFILLLAIIGVYYLAFIVLKKRWLSFCVALLFSFIPVIYDLSRIFLLDLALLTWVVWGLYFFLKSNYLNKRKYAIVWVIYLILASLTKLNGLLYFIPMIVWSLYVLIKTKKQKILFNLIICGIIYLVFVGWWWFMNFANIQSYLTGLAGQGESLTDPMNLFAWRTWLHYFKLFFLHQFHPIPTLIFLISFIYWLRSSLNKNIKYFLLFFLIFNYVIFTIVKNKDWRFILPLLPIISLITASGFAQMLKKAKRKYITWGLIGVFSFYLGFIFLNNSFNWPIKKEFRLTTPTFVFDEVDWLGIDDYPVKSPKTALWPHNEIITDLEQFSQTSEIKPRILVLMDQAELNDNNLQLYQILTNNHDFEIYSLKDITEFNNSLEIDTRLAEYDYYLVPEPKVELTPFYAVYLKALTQARERILKQPENFVLIRVYQLPQEKELYLFSR